MEDRLNPPSRDPVAAGAWFAVLRQDHPASDVRWAAERAGAADYLTKPFDAQDLLDAVVRLVPVTAVPSVAEA